MNPRIYKCVYWLAMLGELWTVSAQPIEQRIDLDWGKLRGKLQQCS